MPNIIEAGIKEKQINHSIAWTYFKKDKKLLSKLIIAYILLYPNVVLNLNDKLQKEPSGLISTLFLIGIAIFVGFIFSNTNHRIIKRDNSLADFKNFFKLFLISLKVVLFIVLISIPVMLVGIPCYYLTLGGIFAGSSILAFIGLILVVFYFAAFVLLASYTIPIFGIFSIDMKFTSFFKFKTLKNIIKKDFKFFALYLGQMLLYLFVCNLLSMILRLTTIGMFFDSFVLIFFAFAMSDIQAQFIRQSYNIGQKQNG